MSGHSAAVPSKPRVISWRNRVSRPLFPDPVQARSHLLQPPLERQARGGERRAAVVGNRAAPPRTIAPNHPHPHRLGALPRPPDPAGPPLPPFLFPFCLPGPLHKPGG